MGETQADNYIHGGWVDPRAAGRTFRSTLSLKQMQTQFVRYFVRSVYCFWFPLDVFFFVGMVTKDHAEGAAKKGSGTEG